MGFRNERIRVFLGFTDTCGVYRSIEQSLLMQGHRAYFLNLGTDLRHGSSHTALIPSVFRRAYDLAHCEADGGAFFQSWLGKWLYKPALILLSVWIALSFDVLLIKSGACLTNSRLELRLAKLLGRKVIYSYHGSDSRPFYLGYTSTRENYQEKLNELEAFKAILLKNEELADVIIDSPSSAHLHAKRCCLRQVIFNPVPDDLFQGRKIAGEEGRPLRLLHAPSDPLLKGTDVIRRAIMDLKSKGYCFEYKELKGVSNKQVIEEILASDIIVDEMYSDNYAGIFALEGLAAKKVVVVGGYAFEHLDSYVPEWARAPTVRTRPEELAAVLETLITDEKLRLSFRDKAEAYTRGTVSPKAVVERLLTLARGAAPSEWFFDPGTIQYIDGAAAPVEEIYENIRRVYQLNEGRTFLVDDKKTLHKLLVSTGSSIPGGEGC
ncbi:MULTISPECIES: glycosyltransferase [unclassified Thalassospira]|uniref:glycosyltransferase n=1 Tax=unclassified Thalassospira TaxID=2648997 RepID=UPI001B02835F|nr:glycosyltransferase [Thalassospira sp.]MBO6769749.1 glycosyltransferase [Thalassospira sp.]